MRCIGVLSEEIVDFRNFFLNSGYRDHLLNIIDHQKTHVANVDLTRAGDQSHSTFISVEHTLTHIYIYLPDFDFDFHHNVLYLPIHVQLFVRCPFCMDIRT